MMKTVKIYHMGKISKRLRNSSCVYVRGLENDSSKIYQNYSTLKITVKISLAVRSIALHKYDRLFLE